jgi:hypothetical protein
MGLVSRGVGHRGSTYHRDLVAIRATARRCPVSFAAVSFAAVSFAAVSFAAVSFAAVSFAAVSRGVGYPSVGAARRKLIRCSR